MRPIRLELQGFTAFREKCEIDFSTFDLFAITGQTGAGKTSLLDAMTYSLYGKTSRLNKAGKDLISQGAVGMSVVLHFRVGRDEYKVARAIKGSTVNARLEKLQEGEWKGLSGSIAEINELVPGIVGLDFDGFTKAVILPQGRFDVFLRGKPDERREVLNDLLDIRVYQRMMQSANEKSRLSGERAKVKEAEVDPMATPEAKAERERALVELVAGENALADAVTRLLKALPDALSLREKRNALLCNQNELVETQRKIAAAETTTADAKRAAERQRESIERLDHQIRIVAYDSELHLKLTQLEQPALQREKLNDQVREQVKKREVECEKLADAEQKAQAAREVLDTITAELKHADQSRGLKKALYDELEARHGSAHALEQVIKELDTAKGNGVELPKLHQSIARLEALADALPGAFEAAQKDVAKADADVEGASQQYEHIHARDRVAAIRHELRPGEACPVCEQTVHSVPKGPDATELYKAEQQLKEAKAGLKKAQEHLLAIRTESESLPGKIDLARKHLEMHESAIRSATELASQIIGRPADEGVTNEIRLLIEQFKTAKLASQNAQSHYEKVLGDERDASKLFQDAEHKHQLIVSQIDNIDKLIADCREEIAGLDEVLEGTPPLLEIVSQLKTLHAAKQERDQLEEARKKKEEALKQAEELVVRCTKDGEVLENAKSKCLHSIEEVSLEITKLGKQVSKELGDLELAAFPDEAAQIERLRADRQKDLESAQACVQKCNFTIQALTVKLANNDRLRGEVAQDKAEEALYRDLGTWLNAGNFQQYLLSSAFELLATEGSKHLKALSNDRYTFTYKDKEFEVIDKWNGDETRSVSTLSGGESFLASLALALALAESIAELNSAGGAIALESLFLDEGFSTLDNETLSKVADAIQLLQDGKRLIGIVTHIQSLADEMPVRIEIEKTVSGSRIRQPTESRVESG